MALGIGTLLVTLLYLGLNQVFIYAAPLSELKQTVSSALSSGGAERVDVAVGERTVVQQVDDTHAEASSARVSKEHFGAAGAQQGGPANRRGLRVRCQDPRNRLTAARPAG